MFQMPATPDEWLELAKDVERCLVLLGGITPHPDDDGAHAELTEVLVQIEAIVKACHTHHHNQQFTNLTEANRG